MRFYDRSATKNAENMFHVLNSSEGPCRMRMRVEKICLSQCKRGIRKTGSKLKLNDSTATSETNKPSVAPCTTTMLDTDDFTKEKGADLECGFQPGEQLVALFMCSIISPFSVKKGELLIGRNNFYFKEDIALKPRETFLFVSGISADLGSWSRDTSQLPFWCNACIQEVHNRRYLLQHNALEIFLTNGTTLLIAFQTTPTRDEARDVIITQHLPNFIDYSDSAQGSIAKMSFTAMWLKGSISNFEYLMHLNKLAGRSFNDLTQYPVMPFILRDYESDELDLNDPKTFRDLSKPMGAQDPDRLAKFLTKYEDLAELDQEPYFYGSHYSNVGSVLHFLVRLEPFTQLFLELQGGVFDFADRTFFSLKQTWMLSSQISTSDVKELIPEFFYLPEFLENVNECDFGQKQNGDMVDKVILPPWAKGSARRFIYLHRKALESPYVSQHLHTWIDLIFGCKQTGEAAIKAYNLFFPESYEGSFDIEKLDDPIQREAKWGMVRSFGQTPKKLLQRPHVVMQAAQQQRVAQSFDDILWERTTSSPVYSLNVFNSTDVV